MGRPNLTSSYNSSVRQGATVCRTEREIGFACPGASSSSVHRHGVISAVSSLSCTCMHARMSRSSMNHRLEIRTPADIGNVRSIPLFIYLNPIRFDVLRLVVMEVS